MPEQRLKTNDDEVSATRRSVMLIKSREKGRFFFYCWGGVEVIQILTPVGNSFFLNTLRWGAV